jgi:outer membrane protein TolC
MMITLLFSLLSSAQADSTFFNDLENFKNQSLSIQTERANVDASSDFLLSKKLFWTPTLSVSGNQKKTQTTLNHDTTTDDINYLEGDVTWNLFRGGADWNSLQAARASDKAASLQLLNESLRVEVKASDLIFKSIYLVETERIQEGLLKLKEESLRIVSDRYTQGKLPSQDVTKAEVDLTQQKNKVRLAKLDVSENKSQIVSSFVAHLETTEWPFAENLTVNLNDQQKLPLIEQKYWLAQSKEALWLAAKGGHWPSLDLSLIYQDSPIKERTSQQWVGLLTFTLPLWSRFETTAQISSAFSSRVAALNDFRDTEQSLKQRVVFLREKIDVARTNLSEAKKNLDKTRRLYDDILRSFRLGRMSTNDLFIEQNRLFESQTALALSQLSFHQTLIESCALVGQKASDCLKSF